MPLLLNCCVVLGKSPKGSDLQLPPNDGENKWKNVHVIPSSLQDTCACKKQ